MERIAIDGFFSHLKRVTNALFGGGDVVLRFTDSASYFFSLKVSVRLADPLVVVSQSSYMLSRQLPNLPAPENEAFARGVRHLT